MAVGKIDAFDVEALESAVNDSATRVSAIWISFLVFSLYLLTAATTVTQRQLLLADPVKLPILNIELPLWGFFFLAPILFVILHIYVLLQVLLLGRTTAAYDIAMARADLSPEENTSLRQRLANTLFAQIFAGSPRERQGFVGAMLRTVVWLTLAIGPILVLLAFQFSFLAYHSHIATWTHRLLIAIELVAFFLIWPLALDANRDFQWPKVGSNLKRLVDLPAQLCGPTERRRDGRLWLREQRVWLSAYFFFVVVSLSIATFPGEWHVNLFTLEQPSSVQCDRWVQRKFERIDLRFDRLNLPQVDVVDDDILAKIVQHTSDRGLEPNDGERTQNFRGRDFSCGDFSSGDFRRVDLTGAKMTSINLSNASLEGASLDSAELQHAILSGNFQAASFRGAKLQGAHLVNAWLQGSRLDGAQLQGSGLLFARLQGADLRHAKLQGAFLGYAKLHGASLEYAQLQGASLEGAVLYGASMGYAEFQGASLEQAQLQGAFFAQAQLQGSSLDKANTYLSNFSQAWVWRARGQKCTATVASDLRQDKVIHALNPIAKDDKTIGATSSEISDFFDAAFSGIPDASIRARIAMRVKKLPFF
jgi:uncharacterized protein YjbI with pentapeptide repeats